MKTYDVGKWKFEDLIGRKIEIRQLTDYEYQYDITYAVDVENDYWYIIENTNIKH